MRRIKIISENKLGITSDVLNLVAGYQVDINAVEVVPNQIHLKLDEMSEEIEARLKQELQKIPDIYSIERVELLPYERRERKINAVLNTASEGIIGVDEQGRITTLNPVAAEILQVTPKEAKGCHIGTILNYDVPILDTLRTGEGYDHKEIKIETERGRSHYFTSGRAIKDDQGQIVGAVASIRDIHDVRKLYHKIHHSSMITFDEIVYGSRLMEEVIALAKRAALTHSTVLLRGESGTGKELFARAIHSASLRQDQPFIPINCAALPDSLLESELFGYEEGTFTGAKKGGKPGLFELADNGTIFLDEIGEIPPHIQVKLLRVLQERRVRRIGGSEEVDVDVRVIAATNKDLEKMMQIKEFREDLYYRLNVIPILIPSLRHRKEDLPYLLDYFMNELTQELHTDRILSKEARAKLIAYSWPGNVRELRNVLERAINLAQGESIQPGDLLLHSEMTSELVPVTKEAEGSVVLEGELVSVKQMVPLNQMVAELEKMVLKKAYGEYGSSREMGKALGVTHTTILNKCKKHGIQLER